MKTRLKGRAVAVPVDRRDVALALNRYFHDPFFLPFGNAATPAGRAC